VIGDVRPGGIDFAAAHQHAMQKGGPALRAMGFQKRGEMLKALAAKLHEHRDELIEIAARNGGNTRGDAKFDLDGASGTLAFYANLAAAMPAGNCLPDGEGLQLGRTPRFWGQHIFVPRPGVAVHINAFNFPAWGMGEKMACALLAGVPVIEKAGTPSAMLAYRIAQLVVDSGLVPEGAFQFLPGSVTGLLDLLEPMDTVAFTGSAKTGALIRSNQNLIARNVRVNVEADSINSAILGPDVESGSDTLEQFLANVTIDMTQKAGQKCTAVRRILVPAAMVEEVQEALRERLQAVKIGNPLDGDVRMGPVASADQLRDVRTGIDRLSASATPCSAVASPWRGRATSCTRRSFARRTPAPPCCTSSRSLALVRRSCPTPATSMKPRTSATAVGAASWPAPTATTGLSSSSWCSGFPHGMGASGSAARRPKARLWDLVRCFQARFTVAQAAPAAAKSSAACAVCTPTCKGLLCKGIGR